MRAVAEAGGVAAGQARPLRVIVLGLRGVVDVQGGIETHARMLYPLLARLGCSIEIVQRARYYPPGRRRRRRHGLRLTYLWSPTVPALETAAHTLLGILYAAVKRPEILHLHAVGPGLLAPLARLLGLRVVLTHHAPDYDREKWGRIARGILRAGERFGARFAHRTIAVSPVIRDYLERRYRVAAALVPNGAPRVRPAASRRAVDELGLRPGRYVLCVARLDRGKRQLDLIDAFRRARMPGWKLALVGTIDHGDGYCRLVQQRAGEAGDVVLTGYRTGLPLRELYTHAGLFVLPSSSEGHPIALLEAISYGVPAIVSAISANLLVPLGPGHYFPVGDVAALARMLSAVAAAPARARAEEPRLQAAVQAQYSWRKAALLTRSVYDSARASPSRGARVPASAARKGLRPWPGH